MRRLRRGSCLNRTQVARAALIVGAVGVICAVGATLGRGHEAAVPADRRSVAADPLALEFERCNRLGYPALDDSRCAAAWAEHRRRFFMDRSRPGAPPLLGSREH